MFNYNLVFGNYFPINSPVHRLNPKVKLLIFFGQIIVIFLPLGFRGYLLIIIFNFIYFTFSKNNFFVLLKPIKTIFFLFILLFSANFLFNGKEVALLKLKIAFSLSLYICLRIYLTITSSLLLTSTTLPFDITLAIEDLFKPLSYIGFPVRIFSTIISLVLRSFPMIFQEADIIMKAQASRGVDFYKGKFKDKIKSLLSLIIPLFILSFQKSENLANAMDVRGFDIYAKRTRYRQFKITLSDFYFIVLALIFLVLIILLLVFKDQFVFLKSLDEYLNVHRKK